MKIYCYISMAKSTKKFFSIEVDPSLKHEVYIFSKQENIAFENLL